MPTPILTFKNGDLYFEGHSLPELIAQYDPPFFLFDESRLRTNYRALKRGLTGGSMLTRIRYCAKTNNEPAILRILLDLGSDVMVSHLAEAELALQCGFEPGKIAFQRPVLSTDEVRAAIEMGIRYFHAFRMDDLSLLAQMAKEASVALRISLRLRNGSRISSLSPFGFLSRRLGFHSDEILNAVEVIGENEFLSLSAINFYRGTQIERPKKFRTQIRRAVRLAHRIQTRYNLELDEINLGGGLPSFLSRRVGIGSMAAHARVGWTLDAKDDSLEQFASALSRSFEEEIRSVGLSYQPVLGLEPGRSIVADAGILVARVHACEGRWLFVDASRNFLGESFLFLCRQILPLKKGGEGTRFYHLSGNTLNTMDIIDFWRRIPKQRPGDCLVFCAAGAYTISRATHYAGMSPAIYLIDNHGELCLIKEAEASTALQISSTSEPIPSLRRYHE